MGQLVHVIPETDFSFDGRASAVQDIVLATQINTIDWVSGILAVRLHTKPVWTSATAQLRIFVQNSVRSDDEPQTLFLGSNVGAMTILNGDTAPNYYVSQLNSAPIGPALRVFMRWEQLAAAATQPCLLSIGIDLIGRTA